MVYSVTIGVREIRLLNNLQTEPAKELMALRGKPSEALIRARNAWDAKYDNLLNEFFDLSKEEQQTMQLYKDALFLRDYIENILKLNDKDTLKIYTSKWIYVYFGADRIVEGKRKVTAATSKKEATSKKHTHTYTGPRGVPLAPPQAAFAVAGNIDHCLDNTNKSEDACIQWAAERNGISSQQAYNWYIQVTTYRLNR